MDSSRVTYLHAEDKRTIYVHNGLLREMSEQNHHPALNMLWQLFTGSRAMCIRQRS